MRRRAPIALDEQAIYDILSRALLAARFAPGTKLGEHRLAERFGVTRERIRKVLHRLGHERLIDVVPNRGAFVGAPGLDQARTVYAARRVLESGIVARLVDDLADEQLERLKAHVTKEFEAARSGNRPLSIRLSIVFHMMLAEMTGNEFVMRQLQELVSRTAMLVAFFEPATASSCGCEEHHTILQALMRRDLPGATRAMSAHLSLIETRLQPMRCDSVETSADTVLAQEIKHYRSSSAAETGAARSRSPPVAARQPKGRAGRRQS